MSDGLDLTLDSRALDASAERAVRQVLSAGTAAVAKTTRDLEKRIEAVTEGAVPGRLWRAWKSATYPRSGPARNPVGEVFANGGKRTKGALTFWSQAGQIRGKSGQFLAVPTAAAGSRGRGRDLSPGEWERRTGIRLRFVYRPGKPSLLVADDAVFSGRAQIARSNTARRIAAGRASTTIVIFVLLPVVQFANRFAIQPLVDQAEGELVSNFLRSVSAATT
jgi:hypothetical protein